LAGHPSPAPAANSQVLAQNLLADPAKGGGGLSGFMADFGESLPLEAGLQLHDPHYAGLTLAQLHNAWPLLWQTLCEEAIAYAAANDLLPNGTSADDIVFFTRSASAQTPGHSRYGLAAEEWTRRLHDSAPLAGSSGSATSSRRGTRGTGWPPPSWGC